MTGNVTPVLSPSLADTLNQHCAVRQWLVVN